jgi:hypothetical protein
MTCSNVFDKASILKVPEIELDRHWRAFEQFGELSLRIGDKFMLSRSMSTKPLVEQINIETVFGHEDMIASSEKTPRPNCYSYRPKTPGRM